MFFFSIVSHAPAYRWVWLFFSKDLKVSLNCWEMCNALKVVLRLFLFWFVLVDLSRLPLVYKVVKRLEKKPHGFLLLCFGVFLQKQIGSRACTCPSKRQSPLKYLQLVQRQELLGRRVLLPAPVLRSQSLTFEVLSCKDSGRLERNRMSWF